MQSITLSTKQMEDLHQRLRQLPDCRKPLGLRHPFASVLTLSLAAVLAGSRGYTAIAEWVGRLTQSQLKRLRARFNPKTQRFEPPSEPTVRRVLQAADAQAVDRTFGEWMMRMTPADEPIAVDGKTLCGARRENGTQVHLLSALLQKMGAGVAQHEVPQKTNEIPEIKALLKPSISKAVSSPPMRCIPKRIRHATSSRRGGLPVHGQGQPTHLARAPQSPPRGGFFPRRHPRKSPRAH